jgi:hypothetical protein
LQTALHTHGRHGSWGQLSEGKFRHHLLKCTLPLANPWNLDL